MIKIVYKFGDDLRWLNVAAMLLMMISGAFLQRPAA